MEDSTYSMWLYFKFLFFDPKCGVKITWERRIPSWLLAACVLYCVLMGFIKTRRQFSAAVTTMTIMSRVEVLAIALILPLVTGRTSWCRTAGYGYGMVLLQFYILHVTKRLTQQVEEQAAAAPPECAARWAAAMQDAGAGRGALQ